MTCMVCAKPVVHAALRPRTTRAMRMVECLLLISCLLGRQLRKGGVREAFAKACGRNHDGQPPRPEAQPVTGWTWRSRTKECAVRGRRFAARGPTRAR